MKKVVLALTLCLIASAARASPVSYVPGSGPPNVVPSGRDVCWSEPADLNGLIGSSEQIISIGLETELANDFIPTDYVSRVTFWGGYWNNSTPCASGITTPGFNLKFYDDAGCIPGNIVAWVVVTYFTETSVGCQSGQYPMFKWDIPNLSVGLTGGSLYWFGGQISDHSFPPQGGRLAAAVITGCDTVFKSAYFGFPDWTPAVDVFGVAFDASQEFECNGIGGSGACCFPDGHCETTGFYDCLWRDGDFLGGSCAPNPCGTVPSGACCIGDQGECRLWWPSECTGEGGQYQGDGTTCDPNPCHITPVKSTTWGAIKGGYR